MRQSQTSDLKPGKDALAALSQRWETAALWSPSLQRPRQSQAIPGTVREKRPCIERHISVSEGNPLGQSDTNGAPDKVRGLLSFWISATSVVGGDEPVLLHSCVEGAPCDACSLCGVGGLCGA